MTQDTKLEMSASVEADHDTNVSINAADTIVSSDEALDADDVLQVGQRAQNDAISLNIDDKVMSLGIIGSSMNSEIFVGEGIALDELIAACHQVRGNSSFFARQGDNLGTVLLPARRLHAAIVNNPSALDKVRHDPAFGDNKRVTKDAAVLSVKLVLQPRPRSLAEHGRCSDYARIVDCAFKHNMSDADFVEIFVIGMFKKLLAEIRAAAPKRMPKKHVKNVTLEVRVISSRTQVGTVKETISMIDFNDESKRAAILSTLIAKAASIRAGTPVAPSIAPFDGSEVSNAPDEEPTSEM